MLGEISLGKARLGRPGLGKQHAAEIEILNHVIAYFGETIGMDRPKKEHQLSIIA